MTTVVAFYIAIAAVACFRISRANVFMRNSSVDALFVLRTREGDRLFERAAMPIDTDRPRRRRLIVGRSCG